LEFIPNLLNLPAFLKLLCHTDHVIGLICNYKITMHMKSLTQFILKIGCIYYWN
jgi:hypothetical protein